MKYKSCIALTDPDIILQDDYREKLNLDDLNSGNMYGGTRYFVKTYNDWLDYKTGVKKLTDFENIVGWGCGFLQIFDYNSPKISNKSIIYPYSQQFVEADIWFLKVFHPDVRDVGKLPIDVIHLGDHGKYGKPEENGFFR